MFKKIVLGLFLISIVGCDNIDFMRKYSGTGTATALTQNNSHNSLLKWAVINRSKVISTINENFKKNNPYPKEIDQDFEQTNSDRYLLVQQVSELERTAKQKCVSDTANNAANQQSKAMADMSAYGYGNTPAFRECLLNIQKDPLTANLKEKLKKIENLYAQRREYEKQLRKKTDELIALAIPKYAEQNGYQLIINQSNDLVYNHDKLVLDVTDDVIDYILKNQLADKTSV